MSALDVRKVRVLHKWIAIAEDDLSTAKDLMALPTEKHVAKISFHAQQSVEKYLKSWLVFKEIEFPYTHNIKTLLDLCRESGGQEWTEELRSGEKLSHYAVLIRYPFEGEEITSTEAAQAIEIAGMVESKLRSILKEGIKNEYEKQTDEDIRREYEQIELLNE